MRAARLPAWMAVATAPLSHHIVTVVNSNPTYQRFATQEPSGNMQLSSLQPSDWQTLLNLCRSLCHPQRSFSISFPGDISRPQDGARETGGHITPVNNAYIHLVERTEGDFVPNNLIYHILQRYPLQAADGADCRPGFSDFLRALQAQPPQDPIELHEAYTSVSHADKAQLDPLSRNADAAKHSIANTALTGEVVSSEVFTFYPFPVPAAASIPYMSEHFCVLVNLKPIVPNHLMVVPRRCVGTIHGLSETECADWGRTVALTLRVLDAAAKAHGSSTSYPLEPPRYSIAIQQGAQAGQTVPHLHTHLIPFHSDGKLAGEPESEEVTRPPRTIAELAEETAQLRPLFAAESMSIQ